MQNYSHSKIDNLNNFSCIWGTIRGQRYEIHTHFSELTEWNRATLERHRKELTLIKNQIPCQKEWHHLVPWHETADFFHNLGYMLLIFAVASIWLFLLQTPAAFVWISVFLCAFQTSKSGMKKKFICMLKTEKKDHALLASDWWRLFQVVLSFPHTGSETFFFSCKESFEAFQSSLVYFLLDTL